MDRKTWLTTLLVLFTAVLTIDYFFVNVLFPEKKKEFLRRLFESSHTMSFSLPIPAGLKTSYPPLTKGENNFAEAVVDCYEDSEFSSSKSPKDLIKKLEKKFSVSKRTFHLEDITFINSKNENMRVNVAPISTDVDQIREMHLFKMAESGLPIPVPLDQNTSRNPDPQFLNNLFKGSTITSHLLRETILLGNENIIVIEWLNDEVAKLQTLADNKTLSCALNVCSCR
jgi:hypothetical protein